ncbi:MAG TPA: hypothetical protein VFB41_09090 [Solirubrobacteraceae bacterium]|nr:hypothetical protein [Solirubrobacteraceae bacterium]
MSCAIAFLGLFAGAAGAATVTTVSYGGRQATALFESIDGCHQRTGFVFASEGIRREGHEGRTTNPSALISFSDTDSCNGVSSYTTGRADLPDGALSVRGDLGTASLKGTVLVHPYQIAPPVQISFDLTWRANGAPLRNTWTYQSRWDGGLGIAHELSWYRPAVASGTISDGVLDYGAVQSTLGAFWLSRVGNIDVHTTTP